MTPFRERTMSPDEVRRVLRRAGELSATESLTPLTAGELERRLKELGLSDDLVRRAMDPTASPPVVASDGAIRVEREIRIDGMLAPEHFERISEIIAAKMTPIPGRSSAVGNKLTWSPVGVALEPSVTVHAKDGHTTVRYVETLAIRGQMTIGFATLSVLAGLFVTMLSSGIGAAIASAAGVSGANGGPIVLALGILLGVVSVIGSFVGLQRAVAKRAVKRGVFADSLLADVAEAVRATAGKTRVDAGAEVEAREEMAEEIEAKRGAH